MKQATPKQQELLDFIVEYQKKNKENPSFSEMAFKMGVSMAAIQHRINSLERKHLISKKTLYIIK